MASHDVSKEKKGQNCTLSWKSYGNCLLGCQGMHIGGFSAIRGNH